MAYLRCQGASVPLPPRQGRKDILLRSEPTPDTEYIRTLIVDFTASKTLRSKPLLFVIHIARDISLQ